NFGSVPVQGFSPFQVVQLQSAPGAPMQVNSVTITGDFTQFNSCSGPPTNGTVCFVDVQFNPTAPGARTGTLTITTNQGVFTIPLSGNGAAPAPALTPANVAFASQTIGSFSPAQTITLDNNGTATLFVNFANTSGDFQIASTTCGSQLTPKDFCTYSVVFNPSVIGPASGVLQVDTNGGSVTAELTGIDTPTIASLSPQALVFPPQVPNTSSAPQTITVTNISG